VHNAEGQNDVEVVDAQLHLHPPHSSPDHADAHPAQVAINEQVVTPADLLLMMKEAVVSAAVLTHPSALTADLSYTLKAAAAYPQKFGVVASLDECRDDISEVLAEWASDQVMLGVRIVALTESHAQKFTAGSYDRLLRAAARVALPVFIYSPGRPTCIADIARNYPDLQVIIDHLGLSQPPLPIGLNPFSGFDDVLALANLGNVAIKCTAVPTLSRECYPFRDVWPAVTQTLDAFGIDRVMWGSDITKVTNHTYTEAIAYLRSSELLSQDEKRQLLGANTRHILQWPTRCQS
jgi:L-fuconolactonase